MHLIVPCAGQGSRFREQGYSVDKPMIEVAGRRMIEWALEPVPSTWDRHYIVRSGQYQLAEFLQRFCCRPNRDAVHAVYGLTQGAALTVLSVAVGLPADQPVAVMNADQYFVADLARITAEAEALGLAGYVLTFDGHGPQWSYALTDDHGYVTRVLEKIEAPRSHATVGFYWWATAASLVEGVCRMVAASDRTRGEYYLAPSINYLIDGLKSSVRAVPVETFHGLGTPEQVRAFEAAHARSTVGCPAAT
jgi:dTDP-glucose pyrophosphorylase